MTISVAFSGLLSGRLGFLDIVAFSLVKDSIAFVFIIKKAGWPRFGLVTVWDG